MSKVLVVHGLQQVGFELIGDTDTPTQIRLTGRVPKERMSTWRVACERLNLLAGQGWEIDISQQYFVPGPLAEIVRSGSEPANGSHLRSIWRIIISAKENLETQLATVAEHLGRVQPSRDELKEVPLHVSPDRNTLVRGKGAQSVNTAVVGPALLQRR